MNRSRDKGNRIEREMVHRHLDNGIFAERVPLSGSAGGSFSGDLRRADGVRYSNEEG
jgi:Holliday junction resolvase